ncbi:hypothetical protein ACFQMA_12065 [Halosimplex aquaticum]|uniref:Membrane domain of glycerophosphoryl diester phosphodiesterase n=1 Tax=Halosimplex aquaticum TaxID=3026162 RepID=A0ABD5XZJ5_9EURY|nr:hypothetical protein [Halosimplex aquaticum]
MSGNDTGVPSAHRALWSAFKLLPGHAVSFVVVSLAWSLASLPVVTVGPATLGAYAALISIREEGSVDAGFVLQTLREHGLDALLLGVVVIVTSTISLLYFGRFVATGSRLAGVLGVAGIYVSVHVGLVLVPAFVGLASGADLSEAVRSGYYWTVTQPLVAVSMLVLTSLLLVASALLTVAVVVVFPALAAAFHTELVSDVFAADTEPSHPGEDRPPTAGYRDSRNV